MSNTKKIKLLIITPTLHCGGSEKFVAMVCNHISTELFSVCLLVVNNAKPFYQIINPAVEVIDLKKNRVLFSQGVIKSAVKKFEPDIIFSTANHVNLYLAIFKNRFSKNIVFVAREASVVSINSQEAKMPLIYNWLIRKFYSRFSLIICQSAFMQQDLVSHYHIDKNKTKVIHNATPVVLEKAVQPKKQNTERVYKFITVGRLHKVKGLERLIHAAGLLSVPYKYYIIGEGSYRDDLEKLIADLHLQDNVFLLGEKTDPFAGMEDADLFLMGSYYEGFPNVLLEAGALGIPVIAFDVPGGISEIIIEGENGFLIEDNDIIAYASAINKCAFEKLDRRAIIETVNKRFALSNMIEDLQNSFLKLTENK